jgi:hypothetical protein
VPDGTVTTTVIVFTAIVTFNDRAVGLAVMVYVPDELYV